MHSIPSSPAPTSAEHTDFLDVKEAAKDLRCGERWLRDGANHHGFPHHRLGKSLQFSAQDRAAIRAMHRVPAQSPKQLAAARRARNAAKTKATPPQPAQQSIAA